MMTEMERMLAGKLYIAQGEEIASTMGRAQKLVSQFNNASPEDSDGRAKILEALLGHIGENSFINQTFRCDYGINISIGRNCFLNYDCLFIDVCPITIGDNVLLGPRTCLYTAAHPVDAVVRAEHYEYGQPIVIEDDVWIGGNVVVNPGVTIGRGSIIGSGSVVVKDIPAGVIAVGNPCRVLRQIDEADRAHWESLKAGYLKEMTVPTT